MIHSTTRTLSSLTSCTRRAWTAFLACVGLALPLAGFAQALVSPQPLFMVNRAFYLDAQNKIVHVENVRSLAGRTIQPLPGGLAVSVPLAANLPDLNFSSVMVGQAASYVVYFGPQGQAPGVPLPIPGTPYVTAVPIGYEKLSASDANRAIECAKKGGDTCDYPKQCHIGCPGSCCCY